MWVLYGVFSPPLSPNQCLSQHCYELWNKWIRYRSPLFWMLSCTVWRLPHKGQGQTSHRLGVQNKSNRVVFICAASSSSSSQTLQQKTHILCQHSARFYDEHWQTIHKRDVFPFFSMIVHMQSQVWRIADSRELRESPRIYIATLIFWRWEQKRGGRASQRAHILEIHIRKWAKWSNGCTMGKTSSMS